MGVAAKLDSCVACKTGMKYLDISSTMSLTAMTPPPQTCLQGCGTGKFHYEMSKDHYEAFFKHCNPESFRMFENNDMTLTMNSDGTMMTPEQITQEKMKRETLPRVGDYLSYYCSLNPHLKYSMMTETSSVDPNLNITMWNPDTTTSTDPTLATTISSMTGGMYEEKTPVVGRYKPGVSVMLP
jgi:hypothetical protein